MVYELCQSLPHNEEKNLIDQIKRSSTSISLNIAEGCGADSDKEFRRFLLIGKKSTFEVIGILRIIQFLYKMQIKEIEDKAILIIKLLNGLIKYLKNNLSVDQRLSSND